MLVNQWMSRPPLTITPKDNMLTARAMMDQYNVRALPVVKDNKLIGLLTDRDLKRAEASDASTLDVYELSYLLERVEVASIMTRDPMTLPIDATLSEAASIFLEHKLEAAPVMVEKKQLVGMITRTDIERAFLTLTAFGRRGVQFGIRIDDTPGAVMDILTIVNNSGARLASLMTTNGSSTRNKREVYVHMYEVNRDQLPDLAEELGLKGTLLYVVDLKTGERRMFIQ